MVKKRLLLIAFNFPPMVNAGTFRSLRFAKYLCSHNWRTVALTVKTPLTQAADSDQHLPEGVVVYRTKAWDFFRWFMRLKNSGKRKDHHDRNTSSYTGDPNSKRLKENRSLWQKVKDTISLLLSFPDSKVGWVPLSILKGLQIIRKERIQVLYTSGPPHSSHGIGWALKYLMRKPWVVDFRDPWARQLWLKEHEQQRWRLRAIEILERCVVRAADRVILNTKPMREGFISRYPQYPSKKFVYIPNGFDPEEFIGLSSKKRIGSFRLTHAGALYRKRSPSILLHVVHQLLKDGFCAEKDIEIEFIGHVSLEGFSLIDAIEELGLQRVVKYTPHLPHRKCLEKLYETDVLLVIQPDADVQIPGKIYEYIKIGKPILTLAHDGAVAQFVLENGLGHVVNPDIHEEVLEAMKDLYLKHQRGCDQMRISDSLIQKHDARTLAKEFDEILTQCVKEREEGKIKEVKC